MGLDNEKCSNFASGVPDSSSASKNTIYFATEPSNGMVGGVRIAVLRKTCRYII
jgi:hypothetical protein